MNCPACSHPNEAGAKFCAGCGASLERACPGCGAPAAPNARFCNQCGARLAEASPGSRNSGAGAGDSRAGASPSSAGAGPAKAGASASGAAPERRTAVPKHLADAILRDRTALEGERRTVTVLFADAEGFTPLSEKLDEEAVYSLIQGCSARMVEAVHRHEGTVTQFLGDGIMALFGAPIAHEDSARRAVAAGLDMLKALRAYSEEVKARYPAECRFRVGLNTGPVVVGKISDDLEMDYTALGDTVNLASRVEGLAEPGTLAISESTYRAARDYFECEALGERQVKGKARPVKTYRVLGPSAIRTRFEAASARGLTEFVGRAREIAMLRGFFDRAKLGQGQVAFISGDAGIGKSRMLLEFRKQLPKDASWLEGHCVSFGRTIPYLPIIEILKAGFDVKEGDGERAIIEKIDAAARKWKEPAPTGVACAKFLLNVDPGDDRVAKMNPMERRAGFLEGLRALAIERSRGGPLVIVIEDLHWADERTEETLAAMADWIAAKPILLLLTHRPGYAQKLGERSYFSRIALASLEAPESAAMIRSVLHASHLPGELAGLVVSKAEGNPFYVEEVTKSLLESGVLARRDGGYALERSIDQIVIPNTIQEVILSRIDRLEREARGAIQLASVIGREFAVRLLGRISDLEGKLEDLLGELKQLELIYEVGRVSELSYMFKHALTHDVAYSTLLLERRQALHRIVAAAIEELYADRLAEHCETLAHHYERGEAWDKALKYQIQAARKAAAAYANLEAIDFYRRALEACERIGDSALETAISISTERGFVNMTIGRLADAAADAARMEALARRAGDERKTGLALAYQGMADFWAHNPQEAERKLREALRIGEEGGYDEVSLAAGVWMLELMQTWNRHEESKPFRALCERLAPKVSDPTLASWWSFFGSHQLSWQGRFSASLAHIERWRAHGQQAPDAMTRFGFRWVEGLALGATGKYEEALALFGEILETSERIGEVLIRIRTLNSVGWIYGELEQHEEAAKWNQRGLDEAVKANLLNPEVENNARLNLGDNMMALGRIEEAREQFERVEERIRNPGPHDFMMIWRYSQHLFHSLGEFCLARGELGRARSLAEECLALAETSESRKYIAKGRRLRAQTAMAEGRLADAEQDLEAALELAKSVGNPPQIWKTLAALGDLRAAQGEGDAAAAKAARREAIQTIDAALASISDENLRAASFRSEAVSDLRRKAGN